MSSLSALLPAALPLRFAVSLDDYATALALAPDGSGAAVATASGRVRVIDRDGATTWERELHRGGALSLAWGSRALASGGHDERACLVDGARGDVLAEVGELGAWAEHLAWSPAGDRLAIGAGRAVRIVSDRGSPISIASDQGSTVAGIAWSPRGDALASASYGGARIFDPANGSLLRHLAWKGSLISIAWSPDARVLACGSQDCSVHFWRLESGDDSEMRGYPSKPKALAWDAASGLLATGGDAAICVWTFTGKGPEGTRPRTLERHARPITALAFHPRKGMLASGAQDGTLCVWDTGRSRARAEARLGAAITQLAWWPDGSGLLACSAEGDVSAFAAP